MKLQRKEKDQCVKIVRTEEVKKRKSSSSVETHKTDFDPVTGKKVSQTKEISRHAEVTEEAKRQEAILIEIRERQSAFNTLREMTPLQAQNQSNLFSCYIEDVEMAMLSFEKARKKLGLEWNGPVSFQSSVWTDPDMALVFLFNRPSKKLPEFDGHGSILACLWTFEEMNCFGLCKNLSNQVTNNQCDSIFMVDSKIISWYVFGCLLVDHVPILKLRMRQSILNHRDSFNFPHFVRIEIPLSDDQPVSVILKYSFSLQHPPLQEMPSATIDSAQADGETIINCDGPLVMLFSQVQIKEAILSHMQHRATKHIPIEAANIQDSIVTKFIERS